MTCEKCNKVASVCEADGCCEQEQKTSEPAMFGGVHPCHKCGQMNTVCKRKDEPAPIEPLPVKKQSIKDQVIDNIMKINEIIEHIKKGGE